MGRVKRQTATLVLILSSALLNWSAANGQTSQTSLAYQLSIGKSQYAPGEGVEMHLVVRNETAESLTVYFPSTQRYDFVVRARGAEVWRWSRGKAFLAVVQTILVRPQETLEYAETWNQRNSDGRPVLSGSYEVVAVFLGTKAPGLGAVETTPVSFRVASAESPRVRVAIRSSGSGASEVSEVLVNGIVVIRIRVSAGEMSRSQRAEAVAARLIRMLSTGIDPSELAVGSVAAEVAVLWHGQLVVTADAVHARLNNTTPLALAGLWRRALAEALTTLR